MLSLERADGSRRVGWESLVGLLLVPLVVAGGFLLATWKSDTRLDRVQAAVVNLDHPVTIGKQTVPLGRQLAGGLVNGDGSDQNFDWVLTDAADASSGLSSGRYAAVVTVPADFSARATSYTDQTGDSAERATLDVQTSQVTGIADPVVGQAITAAATRALNTSLTSAYLDNIYLGFNTTAKQFAKVADAAGQLAKGSRGLADGLGRTADGTSSLADGLGQLDDGGASLASGASQLSSGLAAYADGVDTLADGTTALPGGARTLARGAQAAADGADQLADGSAGIASGLTTYQKSLRAQAAKLAATPAPRPGAVPSCPQTEPALTPEQCAAVLQLVGAAASQAAQQAGAYAGAQGAAKALEGAADGLSTKRDGQSLLSGSAALASGQRQAARGLQQLADGTDSLADGLKPLAAGIRKLDTGAAGLAAGAEGLSNGVTQYTGGVHSTATGAAKLSSGVAKLAGGGDKLADGTEQLADGLAKGADQVPTYDKTARQKLSEVVAAPVSTPTVHSAFSNVATTTLLAALALWLGALAAFLVLRPVAARALSSMQPSWRLTLGSLAPAAALAVVQAGVLTGLLAALLDLGAGPTVRLLGLSVLAGLAFVAVNHALAAWFGGVGRFVSVVLLVLTVAGAMTSAVPAFFDAVTPLLPLTPALQGMRAVVTGGTAGAETALLLAWLVVGLAAGLLAVARRRVARPLPVLVPAAVR